MYAIRSYYAMGAEVKTALNIVGFDRKNFGKDALVEILKGGNEKIRECRITSYNVCYTKLLRAIIMIGAYKANALFIKKAKKMINLVITSYSIHYTKLYE